MADLIHVLKLAHMIKATYNVALFKSMNKRQQSGHSIQ
jgi:hypothetical protein